jgi:hypothetical protein
VPPHPVRSTVLEQPPHATRCLKQEGLRSVWLVERPGCARTTLKLWPLDLATRLKLALGVAQVQRQLRGSRRLQAAGILTPSPVGPWRAERIDGRWVIALEMSYQPGQTALSLLEGGDLNEDALRSACRSIGRMVITLSQRRLVHRDLKLNNIIVDASRSPPEVAAIDAIGVRRMHDGVAAAARMLERLAVLTVELRVSIPHCAWFTLLCCVARSMSRHDRLRLFQRLRAMKPPAP